MLVMDLLRKIDNKYVKIVDYRYGEIREIMNLTHEIYRKMPRYEFLERKVDTYYETENLLEIIIR